MAETEGPSLESQFKEFAKKMDRDRDGTTINLSNSDFWLRQSKILDDRGLTMTDTGKLFFEKYSTKTEITFEEWLNYLEALCATKNMDIEQVKVTLTSCGLPGEGCADADPPNYRAYFDNRRPYCNATFDSFLCWPPTRGGEVAMQSCPPARLSDVTRDAFRRCSEDGRWLGKKADEVSPAGWTNYTPCFPPEVQSLFVKFYEKQNEKNAQLKFEIAQRTRYLEIVGFSSSLVFLAISLIIFMNYRSLRNNRTRIHKSLFSAMVVQVLIRLILYFDQAFIRSNLGDQSTYDDVTLKGIDNMPYLCESTYTLLEYATTVMFMWMFIEGMYLHNVVTGNSLRERNSHMLYYAIGWGIPFINILIWAISNAIHYSQNKVMKCWYGYNFSKLYWIVQVPRIAVILVNFCFLLNIMRVLIVKLKQSENTEVEKVRKAVRAALVLLPLLGITNVLNMTEAPLDGDVWQFAVWSYCTHFLRSFQGFFIALIYCFLNGEVRQVVRKQYEDYMAMHPDARRHRESIFHFLSSSGEHRPDPRIMNRVPTPSKPTWMQLRLPKRDSTAAIMPLTMEMRPIRHPEIKLNGMPEPTNEDREPSLAEPEDFAETQFDDDTNIELELEIREQDSGVSVEEEA